MKTIDFGTECPKVGLKLKSYILFDLRILLINIDSEFNLFVAWKCYGSLWCINSSIRRLFLYIQLTAFLQ